MLFLGIGPGWTVGALGSVVRQENHRGGSVGRVDVSVFILTVCWPEVEKNIPAAASSFL